MTQGGYKQFCPVAMASEILCNRWTILVLRELIAGSTRFNELRRGLPRMSPALLSQRLKDLESAGIVTRVDTIGEPGASAYALSESGRELEPIVQSFGVWGQRWIDKELSLQNLDAQLLMWDMRRNLNPQPLPPRRSVLQIILSDAPAAQRTWWLVVERNGEVDLCSLDPGSDVDLYISTDLYTMTAIWMGYDTTRAASADDRLVLTGDSGLKSSINEWLGLSRFAKVDRKAS